MFDILKIKLITIETQTPYRCISSFTSYSSVVPSPSFVTQIIRTVRSPFRNSIGVNLMYKLDARGDNYRPHNPKLNSLVTYTSKLSLCHIIMLFTCCSKPIIYFHWKVHSIY